MSLDWRQQMKKNIIQLHDFHAMIIDHSTIYETSNQMSWRQQKIRKVIVKHRILKHLCAEISIISTTCIVLYFFTHFDIGSENCLPLYRSAYKTFCMCEEDYYVKLFFTHQIFNSLHTKYVCFISISIANLRLYKNKNRRHSNDAYITDFWLFFYLFDLFTYLLASVLFVDCQIKYERNEMHTNFEIIMFTPFVWLSQKTLEHKITKNWKINRHSRYILYLFDKKLADFKWKATK